MLGFFCLGRISFCQFIASLGEGTDGQLYCIDTFSESVQKIAVPNEISNFNERQETKTVISPNAFTNSILLKFLLERRIQK